HVEEGDPGPVHALPGGELLQELDLRIPGRQDNGCRSFSLNRGTQQRIYLVSRVFSKIPQGSVNTDGQRIGAESPLGSSSQSILLIHLHQGDAKVKGPQGESKFVHRSGGIPKQQTTACCLGAIALKLAGLIT